MKQQAVDTNGCRGPTVNKLFSHTRAAGAERDFDVVIFESKPHREVLSDAIHRTTLPKTRGFRTVFHEQKNQKRPAVSNRLCSANESVQTDTQQRY